LKGFFARKVAGWCRARHRVLPELADSLLVLRELPLHW
jgi:hypothetical protein